MKIIRCCFGLPFIWIGTMFIKIGNIVIFGENPVVSIDNLEITLNPFNCTKEQHD